MVVATGVATKTVARFRQLFRGLPRAHGAYTPLPGGKKRVKTVHAPPTEADWERHLRGQAPGLGIVPITDDATCHWGAIDVDDYAIDHQAVAQAVARHDLPLLVCRSRSGGAHLFCFFIEPVRAADLVAKLREWRDVLRLSNPDGRPMEVFPKQTRLSDKSTGNWINLPYYGDTRRGVTAAGTTLSLDAFLDAAELGALTRAQLAAKSATYAIDDHRLFDDQGPPCLARMLKLGEGLSSGHRNSALFNVGVYLRIRWPDDWEARLAAFNQEAIDPPLDDDEVQTVAGSLRRRQYVYKCNDQPIAAFCQRRKCQRRGIGYFRERDHEEQMPELGRLTKFETDPPYYMLEVDGVEVRLPGVRDLRSVSRLGDHVCEQTNRQLPMLRQTHWHRLLDDLLDDLLVVTPPRDAGARGQLLALVTEFLWLRRTSESREDLLLGKPFQEGERVYFRSRDLLEFLETKRFRLINRPADIWGVLRTQRSGSATFVVKQQSVDCWWLPVDVIDHVPEEALTVPHGEDETF